ncbi:MAG TPA: hypothetical protein VGO46_14995 [Gemmatimonadaceae bacterium]|nr:hypothetical protein [Gemmatimonadaceae bacterium]
MRKISVKGVVIGGIVDIGATFLAVFPLSVVFAVSANISSVPKAQQGKALAAAMHDSPAFFLSGIIIGSLCSILGGYIAARIAKREALLNGALSSWLCVALGIYSMLPGKVDSMTPVQHALYLIASPMLGALGGALWQRYAAKANDERASPLPA